MKNLIIIAFMSLSYNVHAQYDSYIESMYEAQAFFDIGYTNYKNKDTAFTFTIYAKDDYAITYTFGYDTDPKGWLEKLPTYDNCDNCQEDSVFYLKNPISKVFEMMENEDIYRITKKAEDKEFKVILYRSKE